MTDHKAQANELVKTMDTFFAKFPQLPNNVREVLVKITPWLALVFGILGLLAGLAAVGLSPAALFGGVDNSFAVLISGLFALASSILLLMAFPKLRDHKYDGWMLLFYSEIISVISSLLSGAIFGAIVGGLIGFYILFQIRSYYK